MIASERTARTSSGVISGSGLAIAKMIGFSAIERDHRLVDRALGRQAEEDVGALDRLGQSARAGLDRMRRLPLVHAVGAAAIDDAPRVAQHDVVRRQAHRLQQIDAGDRGRTGAVDDHLDPVERATGQMERVDQAGRGDDRGAVLIVVKHRDIQQLAQPLFDHEALGRLDVFEVDAAKGRMQETHAIDELVDIAGVDLEIDRIDIGKALEERRLALHHRLGRQRAEIAEAEHRGAVRDHRDEIALRRVVVGGARLAMDAQAREGDTRRIGERQIALRGQRLGRRDRQLAGPPARMKLQRLVLGRANGPGVHAPGRSSYRSSPDRLAPTGSQDLW